MGLPEVAVIAAAAGCPTCGRRRPAVPATVLVCDLAQLRLPFPVLPPVAVIEPSAPPGGDRCLSCGRPALRRGARLRLVRPPQPRLPFEGPSAEEREALILSALDLVESLARKIGRRLPPGVDRDELVSSGMVGLVAAAGRYDQTKGKSFRKFASARVYGAIIDDLRNRSILKRRGLEKARRGEAQAFEHPIAEPADDDDQPHGADFGVTLPAAPPRQLARLSDRDHVEALLDGIAREQALVVRAVFLDGLDVADVARAARRPAAAVQALLDAGLAALRALAAR